MSNGTNISDSEFLRVLHMPFLSMSLAGMGGFGDGSNISATVRLRNDDHDSDDEEDDGEGDGETMSVTDAVTSATGAAATTNSTVSDD